ncbi:MAG: hypothetical protein ACI39H_02650 [Lachnospiraceae bacterium]
MLLILCVLLLGFAYYQFVDQPVRSAIQKANEDREIMEIELPAVQTKVDRLENMKRELEQVSSDEHVSIMGSYNNSKAEMKMLNDILEAADQYSISFTDVTRDGDQVRRNFTLQFSTGNYNTMTKILSDLTNGEYRCSLGNVQCSSENGNVLNGRVSVNATATFYETMVGGTSDSLLPQDSSESRTGDGSLSDESQ